MDTTEWILEHGIFLDPSGHRNSDYYGGIVDAVVGATWAFYDMLEIQQAGRIASLMSPEMDSILNEFIEKVIQQPIRRTAEEGISDMENWLASQ